jgi:hypothetical protein
VESKDPRPALIGSGELEERRRQHDIPPQDMVRNPGAHFDESLDQPLHTPLYFLTPNIELGSYAGGWKPEPPCGAWPGWSRTLVTGFVPPKSVLHFLEPVFYFGPAIRD